MKIATIMKNILLTSLYTQQISQQILLGITMHLEKKLNKR